MILRKSHDKCFTVIGPAYIQGLMDSEALLGPIQHPWLVQQPEIDGVITPQYLNTEANITSIDDPRLEPLAPEWERVPRTRTTDDPVCFANFRNKTTGEVINSDPRLLPAALERRGVRLQWFPLE
jgi:hypothetical protein